MSFYIALWRECYHELIEIKTSLLAAIDLFDRKVIAMFTNFVKKISGFIANVNSSELTMKMTWNSLIYEEIKNNVNSLGVWQVSLVMEIK